MTSKAYQLALRVALAHQSDHFAHHDSLPGVGEYTWPGRNRTYRILDRGDHFALIYEDGVSSGMPRLIGKFNK